MNKDIALLRNLAEEVKAHALEPINEDRRQLWSAQNALHPTRPLVHIESYGLWIAWCREVYADTQMHCADPFLRQHERALRIQLDMWHYGDDKIFEPWHTQSAVHQSQPGGPWGLSAGKADSGVAGGAFKEIHPLENLADLHLLRPPTHSIDEEATQERYQRISKAIGDILPIDLDRGPLLRHHPGSIADPLCMLRGIEQVMYDMYDDPAGLHRLCAFLRAATLANHNAAETAGDWSLTSMHNQAMNYADDLPRPSPNQHSSKRRDIWGYCQAQEFALVGPQQYEEFMLRYQLPLMQPFGLICYGCCEDLSEKIDLLRQIPNLRMIAVAPTADLRRCAEQIGPDYVISWRPNPTDMVCCGFDESRIRRIISEALHIFRANDCRVHINLKDVSTLEGDLSRLPRWTTLVRDCIDKHWH